MNPGFKKCLPKSFSFLILFVFCIGCGEDKSPIAPSETYPFTVTTCSSSSQIDLAGLPTHTIEGESAILLADLVYKTTITEPYNYAYRIFGSDGFYASVKGSPDNTWDNIQGGYIVLSSMNVTFDPSLNLIKRYNINDASELRILRKIDFISPADSLVQNVPADMQRFSFQDTLTAIPLAEFIPSSIPDREKYLYNLIASDNYNQVIEWSELLKSWFVLEEDYVQYTDTHVDNSKKVKMLNRIVAITPGE